MVNLGGEEEDDTLHSSIWQELHGDLTGRKKKERRRGEGGKPSNGWSSSLSLSLLKNKLVLHFFESTERSSETQ